MNIIDDYKMTARKTSLPRQEKIVWFTRGSNIHVPILTLRQAQKVNTIVHSLITGPWKLKSCSKSFGVKPEAAKKLKRGSVILTRFASLIRSGNFWRKRDVILAPLFSRHLAWPALQLPEICHLPVTGLSMEEGERAKLCDNA